MRCRPVRQSLFAQIFKGVVVSLVGIQMFLFAYSLYVIQRDEICTCATFLQFAIRCVDWLLMNVGPCTSILPLRTIAA